MISRNKLILLILLILKLVVTTRTSHLSYSGVLYFFSHRAFYYCSLIGHFQSMNVRKWSSVRIFITNKTAFSIEHRQS